MILLLTGDNDFEISRHLDILRANFDGRVDVADGGDSSVDFDSLILDRSLFDPKRMIIIKNLSENTAAWSKLPTILPRVDDDTSVILVEPKPDKRTKAFKDISALAVTKTLVKYTDRDVNAVIKWLEGEAKAVGVALSSQQARYLVNRAGVNQWDLFHALEKLSLVDNITEESIDQLVEISPVENIFQIFETALRGESARLKKMVDTIALTEDPFKTLGLISQQAFLMLAINAASPKDNVARDFEANPYMISKLQTLASRLSKSQLKKIVTYLNDCDLQMKQSSNDPWMLLEQALMKIAAI